MMQQAAPPILRTVSRVVSGMPTSDGAGVRLTRVIGTPELGLLDPFLMLDVFRSDRAEDYIAGFPDHPHRGFETVTYLTAGRMRHRDSAGHEGVIQAGGVQWMTAGRGIIHSEMPEQQDGLLAGFQLWINLPARHKLDPPAYQEFAPGQIPVEAREGGVSVRVVAGRTRSGILGPVQQPLTEPLFFDVTLPARGSFVEQVTAGHAAFVFVFEGEALLPAQSGGRVAIARDHLGILTAGGEVRIEAGAGGARLLLVSGRPLREPVARRGPFVMNTEAQIRQAIEDYRQGRLA